MKKKVLSIIAVIVVLSLTADVFAQAQDIAGQRGSRGAGTRGGRGGMTQRQQEAIDIIEQQLMILKGTQLQREHDAEIARLQAIADVAIAEGAEETAGLLEQLIAQKEEEFQAVLENLGIGSGGVLFQGQGAATSNIGAVAVDDPRGALIESVEESGRASRFGLQEGDIVMSVNDQEVTGAESFMELMSSVERGAAVSIQVIRDGQEITVGREARGLGGNRGRGADTEEGNIALEELEELIVITFSDIGVVVVDDPRGALLEGVDPSGRASRFGLESEDIVLSINDQEVTGAESFIELISAVERGAAVSIQVIRDGQEITVGRETGSMEGRGRGGGSRQDDSSGGRNSRGGNSFGSGVI